MWRGASRLADEVKKTAVIGQTAGSPVVELPEAAARNHDRMWGENLRVELRVIFDTGLYLEERFVVLNNPSFLSFISIK